MFSVTITGLLLRSLVYIAALFMCFLALSYWNFKKPFKQAVMLSSVLAAVMFFVSIILTGVILQLPFVRTSEGDFHIVLFLFIFLILPSTAYVQGWVVRRLLDASFKPFFYPFPWDILFLTMTALFLWPIF